MTTRFVDPSATRSKLDIVTFERGAVIPFMETHIMKLRLYVLEDKAIYRLNEDRVEVRAGDHLWRRSCSPQACYAGHLERFHCLAAQGRQSPSKFVNSHCCRRCESWVPRRPVRQIVVSYK